MVLEQLIQPHVHHQQSRERVGFQISLYLIIPVKEHELEKLLFIWGYGFTCLACIWRFANSCVLSNTINDSAIIGTRSRCSISRLVRSLSCFKEQNERSSFTPAMTG